jgi:hypothetical protein
MVAYRGPLVALLTVSLSVMIVGVALAVTPPPSASKFLVIDSEPGDFVGQGMQYSFSQDNATFEAFQSFGTQVRLRVFPRDGGFWVLAFGAPIGQRLVPGTYEGALRSNTFSPEQPSLDIGGNGRGCNAAYGRFVVNEASFDGLFGPVLSFDASFEYHCERVDAPALRGEVRYSTTPRVVDNSPPLLTALVDPAPNADGWNNTTTSVSWTVADPESGIASATGCGPTTLGVETAGTTVTCSAQNGAGVANAASVLIKIDKTAPNITFNGNAGSYAVDQTILISCTASDALSGIGTTSCPAVASGPATNYVGTTATTNTTLTATATDRADNSTSATTTFSVTVTADGICRLSASLATADDICGHVTSIATAPNATAKVGKLKAFDNFLAAQSGKSISAELATLLIRLARQL